MTNFVLRHNGYREHWRYDPSTKLTKEVSPPDFEHPEKGRYVARGGGHCEDLQKALVTSGRGYRKWQTYKCYEMLPIRLVREGWV